VPVPSPAARRSRPPTLGVGKCTIRNIVWADRHLDTSGTPVTVVAFGEVWHADRIVGLVHCEEIVAIDDGWQPEQLYDGLAACVAAIEQARGIGGPRRPAKGARARRAAAIDAVADLLGRQFDPTSTADLERLAEWMRRQQDQVGRPAAGPVSA